MTFFFFSFIQEMFDITGTGQWQAGRQAFTVFMALRGLVLREVRA